MARISFDESEEKRVSSALRHAFGNVMRQDAGNTSPPPVKSAASDDDAARAQAQEEYEKHVIMESVERAKERSGLAKKGVSEAQSFSRLPEQRQSDDILKQEFVVIPFGVFHEQLGIAEKIVFLYLFSIAKEGRAAASLRQIVESTYIGKTCVCQALNTLREAGWLSWDTVRSGRTRVNSYSILRWWPPSLKGLSCSFSGQCSEYEQCSGNGQCSQNGHSSKSEQCSDSEQCGQSFAITGFVGSSSGYGQCSEYEQRSEYGHGSENGLCSQNGHSSESELCSDSEQCGKSLAMTGVVGSSSDSEQRSESGQCSDYEQRRKTVDTTEFRHDLVKILRTVKNVDLKDLKDIEILKDLKNKNNKICDFVDNLCITHVDNSLVPEYLMTMFRIAFPGQQEQSSEKLQIVRKLTEKLQVGFAWYVVLLFIIKSSPYLMGKEKNSEGWKCTLTWALAADNYSKIMQLTYVKYGSRWTPQNFIEYLCRALEKGEY